MRFDNRWLTAIVTGTRDLTDGIRELTLTPDEPTSAYPSGSHLAVKVMIEGREDLRHYSLIGVANGGPWRIAVKREDGGRGGSRYMWSLAAGARLAVAAPESHFELQRGAPDHLLIAGGIGITPMVGMAQILAQRGAPFRMIYAGRSRGQMAYLDDLETLLGDRLAVFSDDEGHTLDVPGELSHLGAEAEVYVCGPIGLLEATRCAWRASGRPNGKLVFETFGSSGHFANEPFTVHVPRLGKSINVAANESMLAALEAASVEVLWDCRRGECGLCVVDVLAVDGQIDHRDVFFSDTQHGENHRMCACVSRIAGGSVTIDPAWRDRTVYRDQGSAPRSSRRRR